MVKERIAKASTLAYYDVKVPTIVSADASSYGLGAVLLQEQNSTLVPIAFASRSLSDTERGYMHRSRRNVSQLCGHAKNSPSILSDYPRFN